VYRGNAALTKSAVDFIRTQVQAAPDQLAPKIAVVLGSGLGAFAEELTHRIEIPYQTIPNWPAATAVGHAGKLVLGKLNNLDVAVMAGRSHLYEGHSVEKVTFAVRVLSQLGVRSLVFTNAAGGVNLQLEQGGLVLISDHINLQGVNPLTGPNDDALGPRFPDMSEAYSAEYRAIAHEVARDLNIKLSEGVYAAMLGPSYETPAEIRYLRSIGADLVGMSTVPEVIVANYLGMRVLAISCVTNMAAGILPQKINHEEVLETGRRVRETMVRLLTGVLPRV
jgi:purine-nucleoside phosphorylase